MAQKRRTRGIAPAAMTAPGRGSGWTEGSDQNEAAYILYEHLVRSRDRLAEFAPLTPQDLERVARVMHELVFYFITPPRSAKSDLPLPEAMKARLAAAARDRDLDLYATTIGLLAHKLAVAKPAAATVGSHLEVIADNLDAVTFDYRNPKKTTLALLRELKADLDGRIAYVRGYRGGGYRFLQLPELYRNRAAKSERPDEFLRRVYASHTSRGLTQADIRRVDPAFYNALHVWCTRHSKRLADLVPATRARRG